MVDNDSPLFTLWVDLTFWIVVVVTGLEVVVGVGSVVEVVVVGFSTFTSVLEVETGTGVGVVVGVTVGGSTTVVLATVLGAGSGVATTGAVGTTDSALALD
jgi:hypothetical protein